MEQSTNPELFPMLLYDEKCLMCRRFKEALERIPGTSHIKMISLHEDWVYEKIPGLSFEECKETIHLLLSPSHILRGGEIAPYLAKQFPVVSRFAWLLETEQGKKAVDFFYRKVNDLRKNHFAKCTECSK